MNFNLLSSKLYENSNRFLNNFKIQFILTLCRYTKCNHNLQSDKVKGFLKLKVKPEIESYSR